MAQSNKSHPLQTLYRLTVMSSTLLIGSMAAYLYGPPPERLAELINGALKNLQEVTGQPTADQPAAESPEQTISVEAAPLASLSSVTPAEAPTFEPTPWGTTAPAPATQIDPMVQPASALSSVEVDPAEQLRQAGASEARVEPWGETGNLYRAEASFPAGGAWTRRLDAVGDSPQVAVNRLLEQIKSFR